jgi:hypothetical protein
MAPGFTAKMDRVFLIFFVSWVIWHVAAYVLVYRGRSVPFRRVWHVRSALLSATAFLAFLFYIVSMGFPKSVLGMFVPAVIIITFINIRNTRFCDMCGKQNFEMNPFHPPTVCKHCRRPLS